MLTHGHRYIAIEMVIKSNYDVAVIANQSHERTAVNAHHFYGNIKHFNLFV
tara:strand:- start:320 stop:472 length:153 start_codon:yes stop_codon:yes gene_type:complete